MRTLLLALTLAGCVTAQDTELMNQVTVQYNVTPSTTVTGYFRTRIDITQDPGRFMQVKPGIIVDHAVKIKGYKGFVQSGYYNQSTYNYDHEQYVNLHRFWVGPRFYPYQKNNHRLETRILFEQYYNNSGLSAGSRARGRLMWEYLNHKYIPSSSYEYLRTANTNFNRINWMVRRQLNSKTQAGVGFEFRQMPDGQYHRIVWTNVIYKVN